MKVPITILLTFLPFSNLIGSTQAINEILVRLQLAIDQDQSIDPLVSYVENTATKDQQTLLREFDRSWPRLLESYQNDYKNFINTSLGGSAHSEAKKAVRQLRDEFMSVYPLSEERMKSLLSEKSMPAVENLRKLLIPDSKELLESAPDSLSQSRTAILVLGKFRDALVNTTATTEEGKALQEIASYENEIVAKKSDLSRDGIKIIAENDKIAAKADVPADERRGIREANEWRLLVGLNALVLDPKLCDAARSHSKDMQEHNFFAHDSPVPGRTKFTQRAAQAGTSASGENIYMGRSQPESANSGWFFSPGHHKNMFHPGHQRIGLGRHGVHWTQLFGR